MLSLNYNKISIKTICLYLLLFILGWSLVSCSAPPEISSSSLTQPTSPTRLATNLTEVAPPTVLSKLRESLEKYQPQVTIVSPKPDQLFSTTKVDVQLTVQDLPIFKNEELQLGSHLHLILDNQPYLSIYDLNQPIVLENLSPGTHTLRVFAVRPWEESFKNEGAYAQSTFHIFTKNQENNPDPEKPLLTYSQPQGDYGAEPIMLDFYLTNAPLHFVAQNNREDSINDWRIKVTINGESFILDEWKSAYLKGFKEGDNWVQIQFIDEQGNLLDNVFNDTVRVINYASKGDDTLSKLIRGELSLEVAQALVDPSYQIPSITIKPEPEIPATEPELSTPEQELTETEEVSPEITAEENQEEVSTPINESLTESVKENLTETDVSQEQTEDIPQTSEVESASEVISQDSVSQADLQEEP